MVHISMILIFSLLGFKLFWKNATFSLSNSYGKCCRKPLIHCILQINLL